MVAVPILLSLLASPQARLSETLPVMRAVLSSRALERHYTARYFSGGRPMLVIGSALPDRKELDLGKRRFMLYSRLPSDSGRLPAGMNVESLSLKGPAGEVVCWLPAENVGYRLQLEKNRSGWRVTKTRPLKRAPERP